MEQGYTRRKSVARNSETIIPIQQTTENDNNNQGVAIQQFPADSQLQDEEEEVEDYDTIYNFEEIIKECIFYIIFLILLSITTFGSTNTSLYYFNTALKSAVSEIEYTNDFNTDFEEHNFNFYSIEEFWKYMKTLLFSENNKHFWYHNLNKTTQLKTLILLNVNILGTPRLRQLRVQKTPCINHPFQKFHTQCYPEYVDGLEDKVTIQSNSNKWIYKEDFETNANSWTYSYNRYNKYYSNGGYIQDISIDNVNSTKEIINKLIAANWINLSTRVVFFDFTIYTPSTNHFSVIKLVFEFNALGNIVMTNSFQSIKLFYNLTNWDYVILICELLLGLFVIFYTLKDLYECIIHTRYGGYDYFKEYFFNFWNFIDRTVLYIIFICFNFRFYCTKVLNESMEKRIDEYLNLENLAYWQFYFHNIQALALFLAWIKLFKYLNIDSTLGKLISTVSKGVQDILGFSVIFIIIFTSFSHLGYFLFGSKANDFQSYGKSFVTLLRTILGDFNYQDIERSNQIIGPYYFITYIFFVFFILINMFLSIVDDSYNQVCDDEDIKNRPKLSNFIGNIFKQIMLYCNCGQVSEDKTKKDEITVIEEIDEDAERIMKLNKVKNIFKELHFSDREIEMFLSKYDADELGNLDTVNIDEILKDMNESGINDDESPEFDMGHYKRLCDLESKVDVLSKTLDEYINRNQKYIT